MLIARTPQEALDRQLDIIKREVAKFSTDPANYLSWKATASGNLSDVIVAYAERKRMEPRRERTHQKMVEARAEWPTVIPVGGVFDGLQNIALALGIEQIRVKGGENAERLQAAINRIDAQARFEEEHKIEDNNGVLIAIANLAISGKQPEVDGASEIYGIDNLDTQLRQAANLAERLEHHDELSQLEKLLAQLSPPGV